MTALKLALGDVILPHETDEIFANEAGRMSCGCSRQPIPRPGKTISTTLGVTAPADPPPAELDRFAERVFSDRPESKTPPPGSQLTGLGGRPWRRAFG
jgi:hypothetical protein